MTTPSEVLSVAASQLGVHEVPDGSNQVPYTAWYGVIGAWCAMFVSWCFYHSGLPLTASSAKGFCWVSAGADWFRAHGAWHDGVDGIRAGDVICFEWGSTPGGYDHVGIVESVYPGGVITIEGNVGNRVQRLNRPFSQGGIAGYGRPAYSAVVAPAPSSSGGPALFPVLRQGSRGNSVHDLQHKLNFVGQAGISEDGIFGPGTDRAVRNFQTVMKLTVDGVVGPQTWNALNYLAWNKTVSG